MTKRVVWIDWLRAIACLMVVLVHSTEPFIFYDVKVQLLTESDAWWVGIIYCMTASCVALFVVASSYLQIPLHYSTGEFFRRRAARLFVPFVIWSLFYAFIWGDPMENLGNLLLNFNYESGHLWFVYMLCGLYLLMPLLSPWTERVSKRELLFYLLLCFATTLIPIVRELASDGDMVVFGPSGVPNAVEYPLWGVAFWNSYGLFYYVSGFVGYVLLGLYIRRFAEHGPRAKVATLASLCWIIGFAIALIWVMTIVYGLASNGFPLNGPTEMIVQINKPFLHDTISVFLMTVGSLFLLRMIRADGWFYQRVILQISKVGYGIFLCHLYIVYMVSEWFRDVLGIGTDGLLGVFTTPLQIILTTMFSLTISTIVCILIQRIPKYGKWIVG